MFVIEDRDKEPRHPAPKWTFLRVVLIILAVLMLARILVAVVTLIELHQVFHQLDGVESGVVH